MPLVFAYNFHEVFLFKLNHYKAYKDAVFQNWGLTVKNTPRFTYVPKTTKAIQDIVKFAKESNMSVRVSGYRK